ncbi:MAG: right-handed parallel beta-helix repeat-containing protein [Thermodesulfobacteriota bacterium]
MKRNILPIIIVSLILFGSAALADGDFYGSGPWGTRITSLPYTISAPGAYYLSGNLSYSGGNGITIASDNVTLDLMGYSITGPGGINTGIYMNGRKNVEIRNGTVSGWQDGIYEESSTAMGHRIINIQAEGNSWGVYLDGHGHLIKGCQATGGASAIIGLFIYAHGTIAGCQVNNFPDQGIEIYCYGLISGNVVIGPGGTGPELRGGIYAGPASLVKGNEVSDAPRGIYCSGGATVIGNTVTANSGQVGIQVTTTDPALLDQNAVMGPGTHYQGITPPMTVTRNNAG